MAKKKSLAVHYYQEGDYTDCGKELTRETLKTGNINAVTCFLCKPHETALQRVKEEGNAVPLQM